jgi:glucose-1-phosphate thymidylyltransferase
MIGIIMAGGKGTRLAPMTKVINKHLLPVFDKPMIYYPLTTLLAAGLKEITVITNPGDIESFRSLLGAGKDFDCQINYLEQEEAGGIPQGLLLSEKMYSGEKVALILGDNLLIGKGLGRDLSEFMNVSGSVIFGSVVRDPQAYGVAVLNSAGKVINLTEKPKESISNIAIPGLYFFDESCFSRAASLEPSQRGELEVIDLLKSYKEDGSLEVRMLERGSTWLDCGNPEQLHDASSLIRVLQERQGLEYGNPTDISIHHE